MDKAKLLQLVRTASDPSATEEERRAAGEALRETRVQYGTETNTRTGKETR